MSRHPYRSDLIDITVSLVRETEKAVLVDHGGEEHVWLPKSMIEIEPNRNGTYTVTLKERLASDKGMI